MIKNIPIIYPNELFYSYLCRLYVRSGIGSYNEFSKLVFDGSVASPKTTFINKLRYDFKEKLNKQINDIDILSGHTLFNFYGRFLSKEEKEVAINELISGKNSFNYLHTPAIKSGINLRYCSKCVEEDRSKFGEAYYHVEHQLEKVRICVHHHCKLKETNVVNGYKNQMILKALEICDIDDKVEEVSVESIEYRFSKYIYDFIKCNFNLDSNLGFEKLLSNKLDIKYYLSVRGKRKNLDLIYDDLCKFYKGYELFDISKRRLGAILRGIEYNSFDILLIAFFEGIGVEELCNIVVEDKNRSEEFDKKVIKLYDEGNSYLSISKRLGVDKETIRKIVLGKNCN